MLCYFLWKIFLNFASKEKKVVEIQIKIIIIMKEKVTEGVTKVTKSKFIQDFKDFINRGNVMDLAVGVIIGGAFGKIVTSLVNDIIMPLVGLAMGGINFADLKWVFTPEVKDAAGEIVTPEAALCYGSFIQSFIDFLIIAFTIFVMIRVIAKLSRKKEEEKVEETPAPAEPSNEEKLLTEIRDLLKNK